jgi:hypothetical protein
MTIFSPVRPWPAPPVSAASSMMLSSSEASSSLVRSAGRVVSRTKAMVAAIIASIWSMSDWTAWRGRRPACLDAEAQAGEGRAQVVGDGPDHRGAILDIAAQALLHHVEGVGGGDHLGRALQFQRRGARVAAQALGGAGEGGDRPEPGGGRTARPGARRQSTDRARISRMRCCQLSKRMAGLGSTTVQRPSLVHGQLEVADDERLVALAARGPRSPGGGSSGGPPPSRRRGRPGPPGPPGPRPSAFPADDGHPACNCWTKVVSEARRRSAGRLSMSISIRAGSTPIARAEAGLELARRRLSTRPPIGPVALA